LLAVLAAEEIGKIQLLFLQRSLEAKEYDKRLSSHRNKLQLLTPQANVSKGNRCMRCWY
jgi:AbiV family abortive infection protein